MYHSYRTALQPYALPAALLDLDLLDENIRQIAGRARDRRVRIASKSIRCRSILERILAYGPPYAGVMCYSPREAAFLAQHGIDDLLIGYPWAKRQAIEAVLPAIRSQQSITLMVDAPEQVEIIASVAASAGVVLPLCLDIDMTVDFPGVRFGVWRSPVRTAAQALDVYAAIERHAPHVRLDGVMGYEAQIAGVGDVIHGKPLLSLLVRILKERSLPLIAARRAELVGALRARGAALRFVNGGGTGSMESTRAEAVVTELTVGSGFFAPGLFDHYRSFRHQPALSFALEVVRCPAPGIYTCASGGFIASGSTSPNKQPTPYLPHGARLTSREGAGEVQTPIHYTGTEPIHLGDPIFFRHAKAGEVCERFDKLLLLSGGVISAEATTYRGEQQNFG